MTDTTSSFLKLPSQGNIDKWKKELVKLSNGWTTGVARGKVYTLTGETLTGTHSACHSWVGSAFNLAREKPFVVLSCHSKVRTKVVCSEEAHEAIVKWLATDSPFAEFILNRDDESSLVNGGVILLCGPNALQRWQTYWVCKVLRYGVEGGKALDVWKTLYEGGVDPVLALLICSYVRQVQGAHFGWSGPDTHSTVFNYTHYSWDPDSSFKGDLAGLMTRNLNPAPNSSHTVFCAPSDVKTLRKGEPWKTIKGFCKPFKKSDGWGGYITGEGANAAELIKQALDWQDQIIDDLPPKWKEEVQSRLKGGKKSSIRQAPELKMPDSNIVYLDFDL